MDNGSALTGIRVVDFSHVFQGPLASQLLGDYGADVIKVERPHHGDWSREWGPFARGMSMPFAGLNSSKRSVAFDMKHPSGLQIIKRLVDSSDVLMHNFRPGVMEKLGLGYDQLKESNPRLVYACSSGWGDKGPNVEKRRMGHDMLARAETGWFLSDDPNQEPVAIGISSDYPAGLMLCIGILMALQARSRTGRGQLVTTDLFSVGLHAHAWDGTQALNDTIIDDRNGIGTTEGAINKIFKTKDGYIEVSPVFSSDSLRDISLAMGLETLIEDPRFQKVCDRFANRSDLNRILSERFATKTTSEWFTILEPKDVLCAEVRTFSEAIMDPQTQANQMVKEIDMDSCTQLKLLGTPVRLHSTAPVERRCPPSLGEQTEEVLMELGYSREQLNQLRADGVIS